MSAPMRANSFPSNRSICACRSALCMSEIAGAAVRGQQGCDFRRQGHDDCPAGPQVSAAKPSVASSD